MRNEFKNLWFGEASAETEALKAPQRFVDSYYDLSDATRRICDGDAFLLIGPKGSGKSTFVEYMRLASSPIGGSAKKTTIIDLGSQRNSLTTTMADGGQELVELSWRLWLWCQLFSNMVKDPECSLSTDWRATNLHQQLQDSDLLSGAFSSVHQEVRRKSHTFRVFNFYEYTRDRTTKRTANAQELEAYLAGAVLTAQSKIGHLLAIDGLDSAYIGTSTYWRQLASLIRAAQTIHRQLRSSASSTRICILCRSDVFLRVPLADSNKIRSDWGVEFDWSYGLDTPADSFLWDLLERKSRTTGPGRSGLLEDYFPPTMAYGQRTNTREESMPQYLLNLTRGTPRDGVMLMKKIQY